MSGDREGWARWYAEARDAAKFYGYRRIPVDVYKEYFALGLSPEDAAKQIDLRFGG